MTADETDLILFTKLYVMKQYTEVRLAVSTQKKATSVLNHADNRCIYLCVYSIMYIQIHTHAHKPSAAAQNCTLLLRTQPISFLLHCTLYSSWQDLPLPAGARSGGSQSANLPSICPPPQCQLTVAAPQQDSAGRILPKSVLPPSHPLLVLRLSLSFSLKSTHTHTSNPVMCAASPFFFTKCTNRWIPLAVCPHFLVLPFGVYNSHLLLPFFARCAGFLHPSFALLHAPLFSDLPWQDVERLEQANLEPSARPHQSALECGVTGCQINASTFSWFCVRIFWETPSQTNGVRYAKCLPSNSKKGLLSSLNH